VSNTLSQFFVEGQPREDTVINYVELRINGPHFANTQNNFWEATIEVNFLVQEYVGEDLYKLQKQIGILLEILNSTIEIFKYGDTVVDDGSSIGCLRRVSEINVTHYGQHSPAIHALQATVETVYEIDLTSSSGSYT
jgi:hypothetical protein